RLHVWQEEVRPCERREARDVVSRIEEHRELGFERVVARHEVEDGSVAHKVLPAPKKRRRLRELDRLRVDLDRLTFSRQQSERRRNLRRNGVPYVLTAKESA